MSNPFGILPPNLFNVFTSVGYSSLQRHYMAILIRIYSLAEFNRFGLARETVIAEIMDYIKESDAENEVKVDMANQTAPEPDPVSLSGQKPEQTYASYLVRRLAESGWIEREQHADYSETLSCPIMPLPCWSPCAPFQNKSCASSRGSFTPHTNSSHPLKLTKTSPPHSLSHKHTRTSARLCADLTN